MNLRSLALAAAVLATSCAHTKPEEAAPAPAPAKKASPAPEASKDKSCQADSDCGPAQLCIRNVCVDITDDLLECQMFRVHFSLNGTELEEAAKPNLVRMSRCLGADRKLSVTIEGNADERGTEEYNLQLGGKRATVVEKYLITLGASPTQVKTISYGENMPLCTEQDEACWAKNRRAAVKPDPKGGKPKK